MLRIVLGAILIMAISVFLLSRGEPDQAEQLNEPPRQEPPSTNTALEAVKQDIRNVTPPGAARLPSVEEARIERLPARKQIQPPPKPAAKTEWPLPILEAAGHFVSRGITIELADIRVLPAAAKCSVQVGGQWPCGRHARAALQRFVRNRTILCDAPAPTGDTERISRRCETGGTDLARWLVGQGWADAPAGSPYFEAAAAAREAGRGMWAKAAPN